MNRIFRIACILLLPGLLFISCGDDASDDKPVTDLDASREANTSTNPNNLSLEERAKDHAKHQLGISDDEKFTIEIFKADLDGDAFEDAIITVNRLEHAMDVAAKNDKTAKLAEIGYMGNYNSFCFYDGGLDMISPPKLVPSSAKGKLSVKFKQISSASRYDILIDYNVQNSRFRNVYTIMNHTPIEIYQQKIYDYLGTNKEEAFYFDYAPGSLSNVKNILTFKGKITNYDNSVNMYDWEPQIVKLDSLKMEAFYNPKDQKYYIREIK